MPKHFAVEWDEQELRVLVASTSGRDISIEQAAVVEIDHDGEGDPPPEVVGKTLSKWLHDQGVGRPSTLVAVGRTSLELKRLSLPPAPDNELPELVRFQAQREFTSLTENSPLDFLPLSGDANSPRTVLAAATSADLMKQINTVCETAGLRAERIVLRPCATAAVIRTAQADSLSGAVMIVDPLLDEVDLTVMVDRHVTFIRTVRLPHVGEGEVQQKALMGELRRTMAAFHNQFDGVRIQSIVVCGDPDHRAPMAKAIGEQFSLPTSVTNPLEVGKLSRSLKKNMPDHPGRFAPLVGMVLDEAAGKHAIDFLNPRRKVEVKTSRRTYYLAAAAALLIVGLYGWSQYDRISEAKASLEKVQTKTQKLQELIDDQAETTTKIEQIDQWLVSDVNWLDEFHKHTLAMRPKPFDAKDFPKEKDAMASTLILKGVGGGGLMDMTTVAKNNAVVSELIQRFRENGHTPDHSGGKYDETVPGYDWQMNASVRIDNTDMAVPSPANRS